MSDQPSTPGPIVTVEISHESLEHFMTDSINSQIQFYTANDIELAAECLLDPNAEISINVTDEPLDFGNYQLTDAERARGHVHFQVRVVEASSSSSSNNNNNNGRPGTNPQLNDLLAPYYGAVRLLSHLPKLHLDELAEDKKNCAVCTEAFSLEDRPTLLNCNHLLGHKCIEQWVLSGHNTCPMCRASIFGPISE